MADNRETRLENELSRLSQELLPLKQEFSQASDIVYDCNQQLKPLGARKKGKPPEVVAEIQSTIDTLRSQKQEAVQVQKRLEPKIKALEQQITQKQQQLDRLKELNQQQSERDKHAIIQNNGYGKRPTQGRDSTWRI